MPFTWTCNKALLAAVFIMLVVLGRNITSQATDLTNANLPNPDSYYKLVLLKDYTPETGFQFIARDNAPHGSWIHWSLPHTWTVWQLHRGLMVAGLDKDAALLWAGGGLTMLSMLLLTFFVALTVANVGSLRAAVVSALVLASSPPLFGYGQLLQITHHIFMLVPLAAAAACFLRPGFRAGWLQDFMGGLLLGLALWISPETMPLVLALAAMRAVIRLQQPASGVVWPVAAGLMGMLLAGWLIDPPPPTFTAWALDHISLAWLLFGGLLAGLLLFTDGCVVRQVPLLAAMRELTLALILAAVLWLMLVPGALAGPNGLIPDELRTLWYGQIQELQPIKEPSQWIGYLLLPLTSAGLLGYMAWRERSLWMLVLAVSVLIYAVLGASHIRMGAAAALIAALAFSIGISKLRAFEHMQDSTLPMREQLLGTLLILAIPLQVFGAIGFAHFETKADIARNITKEKACQLDTVVPLLSSLPFGTVLAEPNIGPELLFKTSHRVVAGNYHHNLQGLTDSFHMLRSVAPDAEAQALAVVRGIDYVLSCTEIGSNLRRGKEERTLAQRVAAGETVNWLPRQEVVEDWRMVWGRRSE